LKGKVHAKRATIITPRRRFLEKYTAELAKSYGVKSTAKFFRNHAA